MSTLGLPFDTPPADETVVRIEVPAEVEDAMRSEEKWDPDEWKTFLDWFKETMLMDSQDVPSHDAEARQSRVGISFADFNEVVYQLLDSDEGIPSIATWWEENRLDPSQVFESGKHVVFVSDILEFAWHLMPLSDGTPIGANYSVAVQPIEWKCPPASGHDALAFTTGNIINKGGDGNLLGQGWFFNALASTTVNIINKDGDTNLLGQGWLSNIASGSSNTGEKGSLLLRALRHSSVARSVFESMSDKERSDWSVSQTQYKLTKMTDLACRLHGSDSVCLPSFWHHEGHGDAGSLQLEDETSIRANEIRDFIADTEGTIDMAWLCSCHSAETASETRMFNPDNPKVRAFLGHLGMGDESVSVLAFEFTVMSDILNGHSIGNAVYRARRAARPGCSSGSYSLIGEPRIVLCQ